MPAEYIVCSVRAAQGGEHVTVRLKADGADGRTTPCSLVLRVEEYAALSFRALPGGRLTTEQYDELARAAQASDAYNRGLCVLGYGANSARTLHRKLTQKGYEQEAATRAVETLRERGYLCEERDAMRAAYAIMRRGRGARRILQELRVKGYGDEALRVVAQALREIGRAHV